MTRPMLVLLAVLATPALGLSVRPARAPAHRPTAMRDWSRVVTEAPNGGFVVGDPGAPVHVVEFGSFTCPHCARFAATVVPWLLANYVRRGEATFEYRHALRDRYDLVAALLARCGGPAGFYPAATALYASQQDWMQQAEDFERANPDTIETAGPAERGPTTARAAGLDSFFAARGLPVARQAACLNDPRQMAVVSAMTGEAGYRAIPGTPAVFVNDVLVAGVSEWPQLDAAIRAALPPTKPK